MNGESYYEFSHQQEPWLLDDGRLITSDGEELFTAYLLPTVGRLVLVREFKPQFSAATPIMRRLSRSQGGPDSVAYVSRRPAKARAALLAYHLHNELSMSGTITMSAWGEGVMPSLRRFIERLRYANNGSFPWTAVAEIGEKGNPHWHLCLPGHFSSDELQDQWGVFNISEFEHLSSEVNLVKWTGYMGKTFDNSFSERLTYRRFHSGPGYKPKPIKIERMTRHDALRLAESLSTDRGTNLVQWNGPDAWCPVGFFWHV